MIQQAVNLEEVKEKLIERTSYTFPDHLKYIKLLHETAENQKKTDNN